MIPIFSGALLCSNLGAKLLSFNSAEYLLCLLGHTAGVIGELRTGPISLQLRKNSANWGRLWRLGKPVIQQSRSDSWLVPPFGLEPSNRRLWLGELHMGPSLVSNHGCRFATFSSSLQCILISHMTACHCCCPQCYDHAPSRPDSQLARLQHQTNQDDP